MSMMRMSGSIPSITALQSATASFAVPKSVMNTRVGRCVVAAPEVDVAWLLEVFSAGACAQAAQSAQTSASTLIQDCVAQRFFSLRRRRIISSPGYRGIIHNANRNLFLRAAFTPSLRRAGALPLPFGDSLICLFYSMNARFSLAYLGSFSKLGQLCGASFHPELHRAACVQPGRENSSIIKGESTCAEV